MTASARILNNPEPGYWMVRWKRGAPEMPAAIVECNHEPGNPENLLERSILVANHGWREVDPMEIWTRKGRPITEAEYRFQLARAEYADAHAPDEPEAAPRTAVDLTAIPPVRPE